VAGDDVARDLTNGRPIGRRSEGIRRAAGRRAGARSRRVVAWQRTHRAVHAGALLGFPATGGELVWRDVINSRFEAGRIAEAWGITDLVERLILARKEPAGRGARRGGGGG
jgi:hypothetical protein